MHMAIVVKWLTQRIVAPSLVGSNPISRPSKKNSPKGLFLYIKKLDSSVEKNKKCCFKQHMFLNDS